MQRLKKQGFVVKEENIILANSDSVADTVLDQDPAPGTALKEGAEVVLTVSSGYKDVNVSVPLPKVSDTVDLKVYINGVASSEYSNGLSGILASDVGYKNITFTEVRGDSYVASIMISPAGAGKYQVYYKYLVDPVKGIATVQEQHPYTGVTTTTKKPTTTTTEVVTTTTTIAVEE